MMANNLQLLTINGRRFAIKYRGNINYRSPIHLDKVMWRQTLVNQPKCGRLLPVVVNINQDHPKLIASS